MIYLKSILAGMVLLVAGIAAFTYALEAAFFLDLRAIMGSFPIVSLLTMLAVFVVGFLWRFRRSRTSSQP
jgi:hypothetical protein